MTQNQTTTLQADIIAYGGQPFLLLYLVHIEQLSISNFLFGLIGLMTLASVITVLSNYRFGFSFSGIGKTIKTHWNFSVYLIGTSILQWFSGNAFLIMAASLLGSAAIGAIRIAQNLVGILHILFLALENSIPVKAAEILQKDGKKSMLQFMLTTAKQSAIPTLGILGMIIIFRQFLIEMLYGAEFLAYHNIIFAFALLYVLVFIGTILRFTIRTIENNRIIFISCVVTAIFSAIAAKPFINLWGLSGVMAGLFAMQFLTIGIFIVSLKSELKWLFK